MSIVIRPINENEVVNIVSAMKSYSDNERLSTEQFTKYLDEHDTTHKKMWYGCFKDGKCVSLSLLKKIPEDFVLLAEIQSIVKGYGKPLLEDILKRSFNIWWCSNPEGGEQLADYYRQFDVEEHLIRMSKWTNSPEYAFFKVTDDEHRKQILDVFDKADEKSDKFSSKKMRYR